LYRLPGLTEISGALRGRIPIVQDVVGLDPESEVLYVRASKGELLSFDLETGHLDTVALNVEHATLGPDGTVYAVDTKHRVTSVSKRARLAWPTALAAAPRELFGGSDQRLVAVVAQDPPKLVVAAADQPPASRPLVPGDVAATRWADLIAVASDSGVTLVDPLGRRTSTFIPLADHPRTLAFSPSGHRVYVARRGGIGLAVIDRFSREEADGVALPGPASSLRLDPLGRWLVARPPLGDTAWVVDLPIKALTGAIATSWHVDLPAITTDGSLLVRQGNDVVAYRPDSLTETGRAVGGAGDLWVPTDWLPRGTPHTSVADATPGQQAVPATDSVGPEGPLYVQVSVSQNQSWSQEMAQQLIHAGLPARVLPPASADEGYRVVLGPYPTRGQAEDIGRKLGRPFWIYQPGQ